MTGFCWTMSLSLLMIVSLLGTTDCGNSCFDQIKGQAVYTGTLSTTEMGLSCQRWDTLTPHKHVFTKESGFPKISVAEEANFCRDPSETGYPWCYTVDPEVRWERCAVLSCNSSDSIFLPENNCFVRIKGQAMYRGTLSTTESGLLCQRWDTLTPHKHVFNNASRFQVNSLAGAANFCRDPSETGYPWCYTVDPEVRWDQCAVPPCKDEATQVKTTSKPAIDLESTNSKCFDKRKRCSMYVSKGFCKKSKYRSHMKRLCKKSCSLCSTETNPCDKNPCKNGAKCERSENKKFKCRCSDGFHGTLCENESCNDIYPRCSRNVHKGHKACRRPRVKHVCRKSCGFCDTESCKDWHPMCSLTIYKGHKACRRPRVKHLCRKSCGFCDTEPCKDQNPACFLTIHKGHKACRRPRVKHVCRKSCGFCNTDVQ